MFEPHVQSLRTTAAAAQSSRNLKLADVPAAFKAVSSKGKAHKITGEPWLPNIAASHVQGFVIWGGYALATNNDKGYANGKLCTIDLATSSLISTVDTPPAHYNHPAGMQVIGDYCVMGIENSSYDKSLIYFYDLTTIPLQKTPTPLTNIVERPAAGAGAAGITNFTDPKDGVERYLLGILDKKKVDFYVSDGAALPDAAFGDVAFSVEVEHDGYATIALLTDTSNGLWMAAFRSDGTFEYTDYADLYRIELRSGGTAKIKTNMSRHMDTDHGGGLAGVDGVHFRWSGGVQIEAGGTLTMLATQRNFVSNMLWYDTFTT